MGLRKKTLNDQCYGIGQLVAGGQLPEAEALSALQDAAAAMSDYNPKNPWTAGDLTYKVERSFAEGKSEPRAAPEAEPVAFLLEPRAAPVDGATDEEKQAAWLEAAKLNFEKLPAEHRRSIEDTDARLCESRRRQRRRTPAAY